jgi:hypothetical protein
MAEERGAACRRERAPSPTRATEKSGMELTLTPVEVGTGHGAPPPSAAGTWWARGVGAACRFLPSRDPRPSRGLPRARAVVAASLFSRLMKEPPPGAGAGAAAAIAHDVSVRFFSLPPDV